MCETILLIGLRDAKQVKETLEQLDDLDSVQVCNRLEQAKTILSMGETAFSYWIIPLKKRSSTTSINGF